mmetsp:Transcript_13714/g.41478  ORF Transcript_13714/g.41478 Transcript_13714/m.41478 type:complete len:394 (+) Transcript_13714:78-1259(+)
MKTFLTSLLLVAVKAAHEMDCILEFDDEAHGEHISEVDASKCFGSSMIPGTLKVYAQERKAGVPALSTTMTTATEIRQKLDEAAKPENNVLAIFDATCANGTDNSACTGGDTDLFQFALNNVLIIQESGATEPDDSARGGCFYFDFRDFGFGGTADLVNLDVLDVDEGQPIPENFDSLPAAQQQAIVDARKAAAPSVACVKAEGNGSPDGDVEFFEFERVEQVLVEEGGLGNIFLMDKCEAAQILEVCLVGSGAVDNLKLMVSPKDKCPPYLADNPLFTYGHYHKTCEDVAAKWTNWRCKNDHVARECAKTCCKVPKIKDICEEKEPDCGDDDEHFKGSFCGWKYKSCQWIDKYVPSWGKRSACKYFYDHRTRKNAQKACPDVCGCHGKDDYY